MEAGVWAGMGQAASRRREGTTRGRVTTRLWLRDCDPICVAPSTCSALSAGGCPLDNDLDDGKPARMPLPPTSFKGPHPVAPPSSSSVKPTPSAVTCPTWECACATARREGWARRDDAALAAVPTDLSVPCTPLEPAPRKEVLRHLHTAPAPLLEPLKDAHASRLKVGRVVILEGSPNADLDRHRSEASGWGADTSMDATTCDQTSQNGTAVIVGEVEGCRRGPRVAGERYGRWLELSTAKGRHNEGPAHGQTSRGTTDIDYQDIKRVSPCLAEPSRGLFALAKGVEHAAKALQTS
ncbi:uncharacterized protein C8Q71DRAFT_727594 [Rhodofomes roseus]|uniref:Uncharacterized protein n=1 Tax=Rhodofomes roseus TaxID=34475 RepID=A0ABQ8K1M8_9APHY|nr:uncharacterized protein C8Q71DRAFT_727594 [Rhodofomes roseus]KAH9830361.1 hypothetical protein C8Q71DRAFT_727594 [Rhodofomes roseus]